MQEQQSSIPKPLSPQTRRMLTWPLVRLMVLSNSGALKGQNDTRHAQLQHCCFGIYFVLLNIERLPSSCKYNLFLQLYQCNSWPQYVPPSSAGKEITLIRGIKVRGNCLKRVKSELLLGTGQLLWVMDGRFGDCFILAFHLGENFPSWILRNELLSYQKAPVFGEGLTVYVTMHKSFSL